MKKCRYCEDDSVIKQGRTWLCSMHYRFGQMKTRAKSRGLPSPTTEELERLNILTQMVCPHCKREMNWRQRDGADTVLSLQHYRDGSFGFVCLSCNTRHGSMPGDSFNEMPPDHKLCPCCGMIKHESNFYSDKGRSGKIRRKSFCKTCSDIKVAEWKFINKDRYNEFQRKNREKRKLAGNPIRRKPKVSV